MSAIQKLCNKFNQTPIPNDMTFGEVSRLFKYYGCIISEGANHTKIVHKATGTVIPIPRHGDCVDGVYIKELKKLFLEMTKEV